VLQCGRLYVTLTARVSLGGLYVLQCVALCCTLLQCVAVRVEYVGRTLRTYVYIYVLQCVAVCCSVLQCVAVCCSVLQFVAVRCSALQCVAVCCSERSICRENTTFIFVYVTWVDAPWVG